MGAHTGYECIIHVGYIWQTLAPGAARDALWPQGRGIREAGLWPQGLEDEMSLSDRELRDVGRRSGQALRGGD